MKKIYVRGPNVHGCGYGQSYKEAEAVVKSNTFDAMFVGGHYGFLSEKKADELDALHGFKCDYDALDVYITHSKYHQYKHTACPECDFGHVVIIDKSFT